MRNLKDFLSLVMAMALIVGMMVVSATVQGAVISTTCRESPTLSKVDDDRHGVRGTDKGAFNPTGILTREQ